MNPIREGYAVFVHDGDKQFGAVRHVSAHEIRIYVEDDKVVLDCGKLDMGLRKAIGHAHSGEDPRIP